MTEELKQIREALGKAITPIECFNHGLRRENKVTGVCDGIIKKNENIIKLLENAKGLLDALIAKEKKPENQTRENKLALLLKDADIWIPEMREAITQGSEWFWLDARMMNLEAWHKDIKTTLKELGIE